MAVIREPAKNPCGTCPYRQDAPSGLWGASMYAKLPLYDAESMYQPPQIFLCHQQDGRVCAGWTGCHDMDESLALRMAVVWCNITPETQEKILRYKTDVPLFASGAEAAQHGMRDYENPSDRAQREAAKMLRKPGITSE